MTPNKAPRSIARTFATLRNTALRPSNHARISRTWRQARSNPRRLHSTQNTPAAKPQSMSERMKEMSRKYGWTVMGIYLGLSVLDFPFCFLAVRWFGTERIAEVEHAIIDGFWAGLEKVLPSLKSRREEKEKLEAAANEATREGDGNGAGVVEIQKGGHEEPSIWTQLILAYGVHKSLFFFRIPITLAITPKVVKTLRSWGWKIGKAKPT
ncbi:peptide alpha-n-acetyltransferase nat2 like, partial [Lecanosticta acicola]